MTSTTHRWLNFTENVFGHVAALTIGFVMMVIGLIGVAVFVGGIFGHFGGD